MTSRDNTDARPVIRDRRRIDPVTGKVRDAAQQEKQEPPPEAARPGERGRHVPRHAATGEEPAAAAPGTPAGAAPAGAAGPPGPTPSASAAATGGAAATASALAERTADLQRVQAEYANYRKRVERDRVAVREQALANVLGQLLPILDDIGRAREHGELSGGFKSVAESIESVMSKLGLVQYGEAGEPFDPNVHEALMHSYSADVTEPTCVQILQPGYKVGERIVRPARVAVAEPDSSVSEEPGGQPAGRPGEEQGSAGRERRTPPSRGG